jgi:MFS family permease
MSTARLRHNLRNCIFSGVAAIPIGFLMQPGNFIISALLVGFFHLSPTVFGLIAALPFLGNFAQVFLMPAINRRFSPKTIGITFAGLQLLSWIILTILLPFLPKDAPATSGGWLTAVFALSALVSSIAGVGWMSWVREYVPARLLGKHFGRRNRLLQIAQITFLLVAGWLISRLDNALFAFQLLLGAACFFRIGSIYYQCRIQTPPAPAGHTENHHRWQEHLSVLIKHKAFVWFIAYGAAWGFASSLFGPFTTVFMYHELGLSVREVSTIVMLASVGGAVSAPAWGALSDRYGNKPVMLFCMITWQLINLFWGLVTAETSSLLYITWFLGGSVGTGFTLALFNIQLKIIPPQAKTLAISVNLAIASLATACGPIIGGRILQTLLAGQTPALEVYHRIFLVPPVLSLLACLLLIRVHENLAQPLSSVVGAMRNVRTLSSVLGIGIVTDYLFIRPAQRIRRPTPVR